MENIVKRTIAVLMIILMSFSVIAYAGSSDFTVSAASAKTISIKKRPTVKATKIRATSVKLTWGKTKVATQYRIYRSTDKKKWTLIAKTNKTSYTVKNLKGNKKYYFKVRAYKNKTKSPYSKVITVKTKKNETVYATKKVTVKAKASSESTTLGTLKKDASIKRTASTAKGWSKVIYKGKVGYIKTKYLTATNPEEDIPIYTTSDYDGSYCLDCGSEDCDQSMNPYTCVVCGKRVQGFECHPITHHRASHQIS